MINFKIDEERCTQCGECAAECPAAVIEMKNDSPKMINEEGCSRCLHCLAVCPTGAVSILGFDPRGIDGLFGRGSRAAIGAWQTSRGIDGFGFLSGNQIAALQTAADIRSQELEEEARRRQEEQDRQDTEYWRQTGRDGTEASLRAYLKRYPDGLYSEIAQVRVDQFDETRRAQAAAVEREYWDGIQ